MSYRAYPIGRGPQRQRISAERTTTADVAVKRVERSHAGTSRFLGVGLAIQRAENTWSIATGGGRETEIQHSPEMTDFSCDGQVTAGRHLVGPIQFPAATHPCLRSDASVAPGTSIEGGRLGIPACLRRSGSPARLVRRPFSLRCWRDPLSSLRRWRSSGQRNGSRLRTAP
jgi:hypothetical protein